LKKERMKDSPTPTPTTAAAAPSSPTTPKDKPPTNTVFRDTRAELAQLLTKKEEIEVCYEEIFVLFSK
jgi:hypothetical protein